MANISAIKLPNNTTYNITDKTSGYTTNTGTITKVQTTAGTHTTINVSSGDVTFNVPTNTSHLTNDVGYITTETDPTVPSWAKASTKPSYTASEISGLLDFFYPVGSYYETSDTNFDPNTTWGGTWILEAEGQVHVSAGSNYSAGEAYGDNTANYTPAGTVGNTTLTDAQIAHGHGMTQPAFSTPKLVHSITQPAFSTPKLVHSITQPTFKTPKLSHTGTGTADFRRWGTSGSIIVANSGAITTSSVSTTAHCVAQGSTNDKTVQRMTVSISHDHAAAACSRTTDVAITDHAATACTRTTNVAITDHAATACTRTTNAAVSDLSGASNTRTAHDHTFTGTAATLNVMQKSVAVNRWHRTA